MYIYKCILFICCVLVRPEYDLGDLYFEMLWSEHLHRYKIWVRLAF